LSWPGSFAGSSSQNSSTAPRGTDECGQKAALSTRRRARGASARRQEACAISRRAIWDRPGQRRAQGQEPRCSGRETLSTSGERFLSGLESLSTNRQRSSRGRETLSTRSETHCRGRERLPTSRERRRRCGARHRGGRKSFFARERLVRLLEQTSRISLWIASRRADSRPEGLRHRSSSVATGPEPECDI